MKKKVVNAALASRVNAICARHAKLAPNANVASSERRSWYNFGKKNAATDSTDLFIYDEISSWWGISANDFVGDLQAVDTKALNLYINSPGGSVFEGFAIYSALVRWATQNKATITVIVDGWAASIASVIAMAGDTIKISALASFMVHQPWGGVVGTADDMRAEAEVLDEISATLVEIYQARTDGDAAQIEAWMNAETWFKGQQAVDAGFADEVIALKGKPDTGEEVPSTGDDDGDEQDSARLAASRDVEYFATIFKNLPDEIRAQLGASASTNSSKTAPTADAVKTPRQFEDFLRANGFSSNAAKSIASNGFKSKTEAREAPAVEPEKPTTTDLRDGAEEREQAAAAIRTLANATAIRTAAANLLKRSK